jgi:glutaredoxin
MARIRVYGADWCPMTQRTIAHLRAKDVDFDFIDIENDPEAKEWVKQHNGGKEKKPTVDVAGRILSEPSNEELDRVLSRAA